MPVVINSNIPSLTAQRALGDAQDLQAEAMERLSTGLRINSAADAAGWPSLKASPRRYAGLAKRYAMLVKHFR